MIIHRYLVREITFNFLATLFVLILIIIGNTFVRMLGDVSEGNIPVDALGKLVFLGSVSVAVKLVPIAMLIGIMLALGRLYKDHEITAILSAGHGPRSLLKSVFLFATPLTLLLAFLILFTIPNLEKNIQNIKNEIKQRPEASGIPIGKFMHSRFKDTELTVFVESLNEEDIVMERFFMHALDTRQNNSTRNILTAQKALLYIDQSSGERVLKINNGNRYDENLTTGEHAVFSFQEHGIRIPPVTINTRNRTKAIPTLQLITTKTSKAQGEIHWRIALILSAPVMALLAFPLSYTTPRQGRFGKLALGIFLYTIYANLIIFGVSLLEDNKLPHGFGLWWIHLLFILLAIWLTKRNFYHTA